MQLLQGVLFHHLEWPTAGHTLQLNRHQPNFRCHGVMCAVHHTGSLRCSTWVCYIAHYEVLFCIGLAILYIIMPHFRQYNIPGGAPVLNRTSWHKKEFLSACNFKTRTSCKCSSKMVRGGPARDVRGWGWVIGWYLAPTLLYASHFSSFHSILVGFVNSP